MCAVGFKTSRYDGRHPEKPTSVQAAERGCVEKDRLRGRVDRERAGNRRRGDAGEQHNQGSEEIVDTHCVRDLGADRQRRKGEESG
jgi:hypothetical protein